MSENASARTTRLTVGITLSLMLAAPAATAGVPGSVTAEQQRVVEAIELRTGRAVSAAFHEQHGTVRWLSGDLGALTPPDANGAMSWLIEHRSLLRLEEPTTQLRFVEAIRSPITGYTHLVFARQEAGLTVWAAELVLHVAPDGRLTDLTASYPPTLPLTVGALGLDDTVLAAGRELDALAPELAPRRPVRRVLVEHQGALETAWQLGLMWHERAPRAFEMLIASTDGRLLRRWSLVQDGIVANTGNGKLPNGKQVSLNVGYYEEGQHFLLHDLGRTLAPGRKFATYDANNFGDIEQLLGSFAEVVSSDGQFKDSGAVASHYHMGLVYDYFQQRHAWQSWNGSGGSIESFVHVDSQLNNAYWHGGVEAMFFGDGDGSMFTQLSSCLDVAGHELTHGVIAGTVDLVYENQPGALNEHLADFFATMIDRPSGGPADWWLGEDCIGPAFPTPYLRHIKDPPKGGQPSHAFDFVNLPNTEDGDWGGVHTNSGIPNKVGYLVAATLGLEAAEKIHFELLRGKYIGSNASFLDFRNGWISACQAAVGGIGCDNGQGAFDQVGILAQGATPNCPAGSTPGGTFGCSCPSGSPFNYSTGACGGSAGSCGGVPASGVCTGATLQSCVNGTVITTQCSGGACAWSPVFGSYQCTTQLDCGSVGPGGSCSGSQAFHCVGGSLEVLDCAQYGKTCAGGQCVTSGASGCTPSCAGASCGGDGCGGSCGSCVGGEVCHSGVCDPWVATGCGAVTFEGECSGALLAYCDQDLLMEIDCAAQGATCGFNADANYFDCVVGTGAPQGCGGVPDGGQCAGAVLSYCEDGQLKTMDCGAVGLTCGNNPSVGHFDCLAESQTGCGDATWEGMCTADNAVVWCEAETIKTLQCKSEYQSCKYTLSGFFYDCVNFADPPAGEEAPSRGGGFCSAAPRPVHPPGVLFGLLLLTLALVAAARRSRAQ